MSSLRRIEPPGAALLATLVPGTLRAGTTVSAPAEAGGGPAVPNWLEGELPTSLYSGFLGLAYWQWLGLLTLIFLGLVVDQIVRALVRPVLRRLARRFDGRIEDRLLRQTVRALGLFAAGLGWVLWLPVLALAGTLGAVAEMAAGTFAVLAGTWAGWRVVDVAGEILLHQARRSATRFDDVLVPLVRKTAKLFILALGIVYGAHSLNINIVPLITGLGIGGLAFAFAAKDTIENFFGSVAVILDRPFEVGDWVVIGDVEGTVEELGFRSTRVRTFYNSQVTVPNSALVRATVDNYGRRRFRRWKTTLGVQYDTRPDQLLAFAEGVRELVRRHPHTRKDYYQVWCNDFGGSSLDILLYVFFETPDWSTELRERERLLVDIVRLADRLGVQFAFPTQTLHVFKEQHGAVERRFEVPREDDDDRARRAGVSAARDLTELQSWRGKPPGPVRFETAPGPGD